MADVHTADFAALEARVLAAAAPIRAGLEALLAPVDKAWEQSVIDAYVHSANTSLPPWIEYLSKPEPKSWEQRRREPRYVMWKSKSATPRKFGVYYDTPQSHAERAQAAEDGEYVANVKRATADAKETYRLTREAFLTRLTEKVHYVAQMKPVTITGLIEFNRAIEGQVTVRVGADEGFTMRVSVKTNYRYGENAADRHLTVYSQYPVTFAGASVGGRELPTKELSEEMLGHLISGLPLDHKERASRAQIDARKALNEEKHRIDELRQRWSDVKEKHRWIDRQLEDLADAPGRGYDVKTIERMKEHLDEMRASLAAMCKRYGFTDPGSWRAADAMRKHYAEQLKAMRAKKEG